MHRISTVLSVKRNSIDMDITKQLSKPTHSQLRHIYGEEYSNILSNANERLKNVQIAEILHSSQKRIIKEETKGMYKTQKKHPILMEKRLKEANRQPPHLEKYSYIQQKKAITIGIPQPACPFTTSWVLITRAYDMNNTEVEVFQPVDGSDMFQWFYTVNCNTEVLKNENEACPFCCRGINHHEYVSECMPMKSYVMALTRRPGDIDYEWNYIQMNTSCNCAIARKTRV
ncbi:hypothetical protein ACJMK2_029090 [Sinanodonta woodiana]|uniref:Nerve growth factor-related domain-containing protein n=1 Tax=Sinanodonta woodiana TaxID=1069815 RepID=A0ABD3XBD5_SINWO